MEKENELIYPAADSVIPNSSLAPIGDEAYDFFSTQDKGNLHVHSVLQDGVEVCGGISVSLRPVADARNTYFTFELAHLI